jgi:hypothetical protein
MTNYNNCPCSADRAFFEHSVSADSGLSLACICPPDIKALRKVSNARTPIELHAAVDELNAAVAEAEVTAEPPAFDLGALAPQPLQFPPAIRTADDEVRAQEWAAEQAAAAAPKKCPCGKRPGDVEAHGGMTCEEVLAIQARVKYSDLTPWQQFRARRRGEEPAGWRLSLVELYNARAYLHAAMRRKAAEQADRDRAQKEAEATA